MPAVVHLDSIAAQTVHQGDIAFARRRLGDAAQTWRIGVSHYVVAPGARAMPLHVHGDEEEIFHVLRGHGVGYEEGAGAYPIGPGDTIVHRPGGRPHTRLADADCELELLAFGSGSDTGSSWLPRAGVMILRPHWVPVDAPPPPVAEGRAGPLQRPATLSERPAHALALDAVPATAYPGATVRRAGQAAGAVAAGLNHVSLEPGARGAEPHCHSREEELFVILAGSGTLTLGEHAHPVAIRDVIARPPGTRVGHDLTAGPQGLTYLVYGTREPDDIVYYPRRGTVRLRGLGVSLPAAP